MDFLNLFFREKADDFKLQECYESTLLDQHKVTEEDVRFILGLTDTESVGYQRLTKDAKDSIEGLGKAIDFMYKLSKTDDKLTQDNIKDMHGFVRNYNPYHASDYRSVGIRMPQTGEAALPFDQIEGAMKEALERYNLDVKAGDSLKAIVRFHYDFERIHPFFEDNGKVGRLLINLGLIRHGYTPITIKDVDKDEYNKAFMAEVPEEALLALLKKYI